MMGEPPPGVSAADIDADRLLRQLMDGLTAIDTSVPPDGWEAEGWQPYAPEAFRLYVRDVTGQPVEGGEDLQGQVLDWPTADDPATFGVEVDAFGDGTRCATVTGDDAATWLAALSEANQQTLWTTDGDDRWLRPGAAAAAPRGGGLPLSAVVFHGHRGAVAGHLAAAPFGTMRLVSPSAHRPARA